MENTEENTMKQKTHSLTIILAGYERTGKTTLISSIIEPHKKLDKYLPTIGADLKTGLIETKINDKTYKIKIKFIEVAGQSRFRTLINPKMFMKGDILIFVYNADSDKSFDKLRDIYLNCFESDKKRPLSFLLCNKSDISNKDEDIDLQEEVLEFCDENNLKFLYCTSYLENCSKFCKGTDYKEKNNIFKNLLKNIIIPSYYKEKENELND